MSAVEDLLRESLADSRREPALAPSFVKNVTRRGAARRRRFRAASALGCAGAFAAIAALAGGGGDLLRGPQPVPLPAAWAAVPASAELTALPAGRDAGYEPLAESVTSAGRTQLLGRNSDPDSDADDGFCWMQAFAELPGVLTGASCTGPQGLTGQGIVFVGGGQPEGSPALVYGGVDADVVAVRLRSAGAPDQLVRAYAGGRGYDGRRFFIAIWPVFGQPVTFDALDAEGHVAASRTWPEGPAAPAAPAREPDVRLAELPPGTVPVTVTAPPGGTPLVASQWRLPETDPSTGQPFTLFLQQHPRGQEPTVPDDANQTTVTVAGRAYTVQEPTTGDGFVTIVWSQGPAVYTLTSRRARDASSRPVGVTTAALIRAASSAVSTDR